MGTIFGREPALVIGTIATIVVLVAQQLLTSGIVSSVGVVNVLNLIVSIVPLIAGVLTRGRVTPVPPVK